MIRIPELSALYTHALGPVRHFLIAGLLILPSIALGGTPYGGGGEAGNVVHEGAGVTTPAEEAARHAVQDAWREKVMQRERELITAGFAARFSISLDLAEAIHRAALREDLDPEMAFGLVNAESRFRSTAISPVGAVGLTQVMPSTANWLFPGTGRRQLLDPGTNLRVGFRYLRMLLDQYGDAGLALTAYNRGPGTVDRLLRRGADPDNGYERFVLTGDARLHVAILKRRRS